MEACKRVGEGMVNNAVLKLLKDKLNQFDSLFNGSIIITVFSIIASTFKKNSVSLSLPRACSQIWWRRRTQTNEGRLLG